MKPKYYVIGWYWNEDKHEYEVETVGKTRTYSQALTLFRSIQVNADIPQVELWRINEYEDDDRLAIKEYYEGKENITFLE